MFYNFALVLCISFYLLINLINLIKLIPLILRRSLVLFYRLDRHFPFYCCCFVCFLLFCFLFFLFFGHWFWHLHVFFFSFFLFFLNTYRSTGLYLSFKIFMRISLFKFILPLHTEPLWMDKWKYAWVVPFFPHFNEKMVCFVLFCFVCLFVFSSLIDYPKPLPIYKQPLRKRKKENTKKKDRNKETSHNKKKFTNTIKTTVKCG